MNFSLYACSQAASAAELKERYGRFNILESSRLNEIDVNVLYSNKTSLQRVYNKTINKNGTVVLAHDDVLIRDPKWLEKLEEGLKKYDIIGLAGGSEANIKPPCLWHIMCPRETHRGCVTHVAENGKDTFPTNFGKQGRVLILDGLFLAFNAENIKKAGAFFDETNPCGFHFYDIDFSLTCNSKKLKLGTINIDVVHNSPGLRKYTDEWLSGQAWFMQKFLDGKYNF